LYAGKVFLITTQYRCANFFLLYSIQVELGRHRAGFSNFSFAEIKNVHLSF